MYEVIPTFSLNRAFLWMAGQQHEDDGACLPSKSFKGGTIDNDFLNWDQSVSIGFGDQFKRVLRVWQSLDDIFVKPGEASEWYLSIPINSVLHFRSSGSGKVFEPVQFKLQVPNFLKRRGLPNLVLRVLGPFFKCVEEGSCRADAVFIQTLKFWWWDVFSAARRASGPPLWGRKQCSPL